MEYSDNIIMMPFEPKRPYQETGLVLRQELINGLYKVGDRLPPERDIAERLDVSRTVVREAIIMLELENLVGQALVTIRSADRRAESRGAHAHEDWPERDDENWMKHTVMWLDEQNRSTVGYRSVAMNTLSNDVAPIPPAPRVY